MSCPITKALAGCDVFPSLSTPKGKDNSKDTPVEGAVPPVHIQREDGVNEENNRHPTSIKGSVDSQSLRSDTTRRWSWMSRKGSASTVNKSVTSYKDNSSVQGTGSSISESTLWCPQTPEFAQQELSREDLQDMENEPKPVQKGLDVADQPNLDVWDEKKPNIDVLAKELVAVRKDMALLKQEVDALRKELSAVQKGERGDDAQKSERMLSLHEADGG